MTLNRLATDKPVALEFQIASEFRNVGFREAKNHKLNPHMTPSPGIEPGSHWWEAAGALLPPTSSKNYDLFQSKCYTTYVTQNTDFFLLNIR